MEAPTINEVRRRKKKSEERENSIEGEKEVPPSEREKKNLSDDEGEKETSGVEESKEITPPDIERGKDKPPNDDICPICFGNYNIACKTNCGHWFCANCLITFWSYSSMLQPCNCPLCTPSIKKLTPQASLIQSTDKEVVEALKKVQGYNRLFEASIRGFILMFYIGLWDHDNITHNFIIAKFMAMFLTLTYMYSGINFLPVEDYIMTHLFFQSFTVLPVLLLAALSVYRRFVATGTLPGPTFDRPIPPLSWRFINEHILLLMRTIYLSMWNPNNLFVNFYLTQSIASFLFHEKSLILYHFRSLPLEKLVFGKPVQEEKNHIALPETLLAFAYDRLGFKFPGGFFGAQLFFKMFTVGPMFILTFIGIYRGYHLHHRPRGLLANLLAGP
ncbi:hypothetical protein Vadar_020515 [Vaccinium darrowii]|uniref:Uncharacterized protein n=1 Tax=Vaccinium darrowii TaxID=229202 RepID=A0ACB7Y255_9ERIC|nr:hypothetical protein Vadar_020515 [Vaccinium darrowii]